jgi:nitrate reductase alpha subunit
MPLLAPGQSCIHALSSSMYDLNTWLSDRNMHKLYSIKTLMHTNTSSKTTHSIKTSLIKQCYTWYAWTGANNAADTDMLLILLCCWYWYATDTVMLLILMILICCWYTDTAGMYALYYMLNVLCLTSIYFATVSHWNHAVAKSCPLKTKQIQHFIQPFEIIQNIISS